MGVPALQFGIAVLYAVSSGYGFDSGFGAEIRAEHKYFELAASATTEKKYNADSGFVWSGAALVLYPVGNVRLIGGVSVYGYESDMSDSTWRKEAYSPLVGVGYQNTDFRVRLQYAFENEYNQSLTSISFEYAMTPKWWFGAGAGMENGNAVANLKITVRP